MNTGAGSCVGDGRQTPGADAAGRCIRAGVAAAGRLSLAIMVQRRAGSGKLCLGASLIPEAILCSMALPQLSQAVRLNADAGASMVSRI
jgi:hypothetical protein